MQLERRSRATVAILDGFWKNVYETHLLIGTYATEKIAFKDLLYTCFFVSL